MVECSECGKIDMSSTWEVEFVMNQLVMSLATDLDLTVICVI